MAGKTDEKGLRKVDRSALPKFASQKGGGWIDVAGTRMCLLDIPGGWLSAPFPKYGHVICHDVGAPHMGAQGGHEARPYSADDALTTYTAVQIRYRICAVDHLAFLGQ